MLNEEYFSYYGIVVDNSFERTFFCVEKVKLLKYLESVDDSTQLKVLLKNAKWEGELGGYSFEHYAFVHFLNTDIYTVQLNYCDTMLKSKVVPVFLTEFTYLTQTHLSKLEVCEGAILHRPYRSYTRPKLNVVFVVPLRPNSHIRFLTIKDTLNRDRYLNYLKYYAH